MAAAIRRCSNSLRDWMPTRAGLVDRARSVTSRVSQFMRSECAANLGNAVLMTTSFTLQHASTEAAKDRYGCIASAVSSFAGVFICGHIVKKVLVRIYSDERRASNVAGYAMIGGFCNMPSTLIPYRTDASATVMGTALTMIFSKTHGDPFSSPRAGLTLMTTTMYATYWLVGPAGPVLTAVTAVIASHGLSSMAQGIRQRLKKKQHLNP